MSSIDKELLKSIRKLKYRVARNIILDQLLWGCILGLCFGSLVSIASLFIPLYKINLTIYKLITAAGVIGLLVSMVRLPKDRKAAQLADEFGLEERMITSLELLGKDDGFSKLLKKDAVNSLQQLDYKEKLLYKIKRKQIISFASALVIIAGCSFIQTPAKIRAEEKFKFQIVQEDTLNNIAKQEKSIKNSSILKEEDKKALLSDLTSLGKEVKEAKSIKDIENSLEKFQIKTEEIKEKYSEKDINNITSGLSRNDSTSNLAKAVESGNKEAISQEIKNLSDSLKTSSPEEQAQIAKNFAEMAKNASDENLKKSLADIADKLQGSSPDKAKALEGSFENFNNALQKPLDSRDTKKEISNIQEEFMPQGGTDNTKLESNSQNNNSSNSTGDNGVINNEAQPPSNSSGDKSGSVNNSNIGSREGDSATGKEGNGSLGQNPNENNNSQGTGSSSAAQQSGGSQGLTKQGSSGGKQDENVYTLPSPENQTAGVPAKPQSLDSVIGKYKERAYDSMNSSIIPEGMKDIIKGYFSSLEQ